MKAEVVSDRTGSRRVYRDIGTGKFPGQGRIRLMARWAIAKSPRLSRGPKKGKKLKKAYENRLLAQGLENILPQGPEDP